MLGQLVLTIIAGRANFTLVRSLVGVAAKVIIAVANSSEGLEAARVLALERFVAGVDPCVHDQVGALTKHSVTLATNPLGLVGLIDLARLHNCFSVLLLELIVKTTGLLALFN